MRQLPRRWTKCTQNLGQNMTSRKLSLCGRSTEISAAFATILHRMSDLTEPCLADVTCGCDRRNNADNSGIRVYADYTDDLLAISENPRFMLIRSTSTSRYNSWSLSDVGRAKRRNAWGPKSPQVRDEAVKNVEAHLAETGMKLSKRAGNCYPVDTRILPLPVVDYQRYDPVGLKLVGLPLRQPKCP
jgi:hypothetical protein